MEAEVVADVLRRYPDLRMSFEEFLGLGTEVHGDWIDGRVRLQVNGETDRHAKLSGLLGTLIQYFAESRDAGEVLPRFLMRPRPDLPAREADLLFICRENYGRVREYFVDGPADLVVEIVSDASRERDRGPKLREYERGGVREYWLIDSVLEHAELYRLGDDGRFERVTAGRNAVLRSEVLPGMWFRAEWFWAGSMPRLRYVMNEWGLP